MIYPDCDLNRWCVEPSSYIADADNYYTKSQVDEKIEEIGCCITEEEVDEKISAATSGLQETLVAGDNISISGNVISAEVPSLSGYATEQWVLDKHYISGVDLSDYALKSDIPTSNSAFTNDMGYITEDALSGKQDTLIAGDNITISGNVISASGGGGGGITSGEVQTMIDNSISGKQDTMSAGTNVQINNNVISATDTKYTAGDNITISNQNVISTVVKFWCGSEAQWGQISGGTLDNNTIYMVY